MIGVLALQGNFDSHVKILEKINLEKSLQIGDEISGHFVFGHVEDTSKLISIKKFSNFNLLFNSPLGKETIFSF